MSKSKAKPLPVLDQRPPIGNVFEPGVVQLTCGCSEERRRACLQRPSRFGPHVVLASAIPSERCHIYVTETDLIELTHDIVRARFQVQDKASLPTKESVLAYLADVCAGDDIDDHKAIESAMDTIRREVP